MDLTAIFSDLEYLVKVFCVYEKGDCFSLSFLVSLSYNQGEENTGLKL